MQNSSWHWIVYLHCLFERGRSKAILRHLCHFLRLAVIPRGFPLKGNHSTDSFRHLLVPGQLRKWWETICCLRRKRASLLCLRFGDVGLRLESPKKKKTCGAAIALLILNGLCNWSVSLQRVKFRVKVICTEEKAGEDQSQSFYEGPGPPCGIKVRSRGIICSFAESQMRRWRPLSCLSRSSLLA